MTFHCYVSRPSQAAANGPVFINLEGQRHMIPDCWLEQVKLLEQGRLLRLIYTHCTIEVTGRSLELLFEDAVAGRLGTVCEGSGQPPSQPSDEPWVSGLVALPPTGAFPVPEGSRFDADSDVARHNASGAKRHNTSKRSFDVLWKSNKARTPSRCIRCRRGRLAGDSNNARMNLERHSRFLLRYAVD
jgi:hypothetical protein